MNIISLITLASAAISLFLSGYSLKYKGAPGAVAFSGLMAAAAIYSFGYAFELQSDTLAQVQFWLNIEYVGIPFIAPFWLIFALKFTGHQKWLTKPVIFVILIFNVSTLIVYFTNHYHHLYFSTTSIYKIGDLTIAQLDKEIWYWMHVSYVNFSQIIATILFVEMANRTSGYYRSQALTMIVGSMVMWIFFLLYLFGLIPYKIDPIPIAFSLYGIIMGWGMFHYRFLDLVPFALEHVFNSLKDIVLLVNYKGILINHNPAAKQLLKHYISSPVGKNLKTDFGELSSHLSPLLSGEKETDQIIISNDGVIKEFNSVISKVGDHKDNLLGNVIVLNDITEQKVIENLLRINEKKLLELNAAREKFFRILAHDLKTPFTSILPIAEILKDEAQEISREELAQLSEALYSAAGNGYKLLLDLLEWGRFQTGKMEFSSEHILLYSAASECINIVMELAKAKDICIRLEGNGDIWVNTDLNVFSTVLRNLLSNAIKFSYPGGDVIINISEINNMIRVSVKDFGTGISSDDVERLFKPDSYYSSAGTSNEKGTGLGLLLAKEMLGKVNGFIDVISEEGKGSEFYFLLPK